jgi:hypothetical protein
VLGVTVHVIPGVNSGPCNLGLVGSGTTANLPNTRVLVAAPDLQGRLDPSASFVVELQPDLQDCSNPMPQCQAGQPSPIGMRHLCQ